jgi:uncharacterized protein YfaS (alpha-2-macroglobulin family)
MLGNYSINAVLGKNTPSNSVSVSVEEYKRPEFEVKLKQAQGISAYGKPLTLEGSALYYSGMPAAGAKVAYQINKAYFVPWFCWWWPPFNDGRQDAIEGEVKTDKDGNFSITFTPQEDKDLAKELRGRPARYSAKVFVTDEGGRTISEARTYTVSGQEYFFAMKMDRGFFRAGKEDNFINATMVNADEEPLNGKAAAYIYSAKIDDGDTDDFDSPIEPSNMPQLKEDKLITSMPLAFSKTAGPAKIILPPLKEDYYILKLIARDSAGNDNEGKLAFAVVDVKNPRIALPQSVAIAENAQYYAGETATILLGADAAQGPKYVEIYKDQFLAEAKTLHRAGSAVLEVPIRQYHRGGLAVKWFSVYNHEVYQGGVNIGVPTKNTRLDIKITAPRTAEPGQQIDAALDVKDENGAPAAGQALITVYDKSLDYYRPHSLNMPTVYPSDNRSYNEAAASLGRYRHYLAAMSLDDGAPRLTKGAVRSSAPLALAMNEASDAGDGSSSLGGSPAAQPRRNFAETAFWAPKLNLVNGQAAFSFTLPERISQYAILAAAFTKNMKTGKNDFTVAAKKDLMLRLESPRFLREGDKLELKTIVANDTQAPLNAVVDLTAKIDGQDAAQKLGLKQTSQTVTIPAGRQAALVWPLKAPAGTGILSLTAVARAEGLSDGEVKELPLLPAAQRLAQSATAALEKDKTNIALKTAKNAKLEAVHLTVDTSLLMNIINAIPFITYSAGSYETATSLVNAYVPLTAVNKLYQDYPQVREIAAKLPKRKTITPPWDADENLLLKDLAASPWYELSQGYESKYAINIFDAKLVSKMRAETVAKLAKYQNNDGGFAWVKGGKSSLYITMYIMDRAAPDYLPSAMSKNALAYIVKNLNIDLEEPSYESVTSAFYAAYVLSAYPQAWRNYDLKPLMDKADAYAAHMTPLGKLYAAAVYHRLGERDKALLYLDRLFDNAKENPTTGIYWAPEERSWLWFNDTLGFHTDVIRVLSEVNPDDARLPKLVKWLVFSKKATMWGNSEAAAKAVYAMLTIAGKTPEELTAKTIKADWGGEEYILDAQDGAAAKITLSKYGEQAGKKFLKATITRAAAGGGFPDFATLSALYSTAEPKQPAKGLINVRKEFYLVQDKGAKPLKNGATVNVGDEIQVRLTITAQNRFDYVLLDDPKPAAFEADALLSGWRWDALGRYEEIRDSKTNFFMDSLPNGAYELKYTLRPTTPGVYNVGAAQLQSMYAPEFSTHSAGFIINVK